MKDDSFPYGQDGPCKIAGKIIKTDKFTSELQTCICALSSQAPGEENIPKSWL